MRNGIVILNNQNVPLMWKLSGSHIPAHMYSETACSAQSLASSRNLSFCKSPNLIRANSQSYLTLRLPKKGHPSLEDHTIICLTLSKVGRVHDNSICNRKCGFLEFPSLLAWLQLARWDWQKFGSKKSRRSQGAYPSSVCQRWLTSVPPTGGASQNNLLYTRLLVIVNWPICS